MGDRLAFCMGFPRVSNKMGGGDIHGGKRLDMLFFCVYNTWSQNREIQRQNNHVFIGRQEHIPTIRPRYCTPRCLLKKMEAYVHTKTCR